MHKPAYYVQSTCAIATQLPVSKTTPMSPTHPRGHCDSSPRRGNNSGPTLFCRRWLPRRVSLLIITGSSTSNDEERDTPGDLEQDDEVGNGRGARAEGTIGSALWNQALSGPSGLLGGQFELRWQRSINTGVPSSSSGPEIRGADTAGYPSLWWRGKVIRGLVPLTSGVETDGSFDAL